MIELFLSSIYNGIKAIKICRLDFLEKLMSLRPRFSFLSLLIFLPLFISISPELNNLISLDRSVWLSGESQYRILGKDLRPYLVTFPFSLIFPTLFAIKYFSKIIVNKSYQLIMGWILFVLIINFIFGNVTAMLIKIVGAMVIFFSSILVFDEYFSRLNSSINSIKEKINLEDFYILKPIIIVTSILLASHIIYRDDTLIVPWLKIYNFDQYMTYILFIFVGVFFRKKWQLILSFAVVVYFAYASRNESVKIMLIILFIGYLIYVTNYKWLKKYSLNLMKFSIFCIILFQFLCYFLPSIIDFLPRGLLLRMEMIRSFYSILSFSDIFMPLDLDIKITELHNEVLTVLSVVGVFGVFFYYRILYNKIKIILVRNIGVTISLSMIIILGSVLVLPTLHPFTGILIAYLVSFYSTIENKFIKIDQKS